MPARPPGPRLLFRLPIHFYRWGLGWLFGSRLVLVSHIGRVRAVPLPAAEGAEIMARYASRHRLAAKVLLPRLMGYQVDGSAADFRAVGQRMPFVRFVPRT